MQVDTVFVHVLRQSGVQAMQQAIMDILLDGDVDAVGSLHIAGHRVVVDVAVETMVLQAEFRVLVLHVVLRLLHG